MIKEKLIKLKSAPLGYKYLVIGETKSNKTQYLNITKYQSKKNLMISFYKFIQLF
jgi:hypothetical protein